MEAEGEAEAGGLEYNYREAGGPIDARAPRSRTLRSAHHSLVGLPTLVDSPARCRRGTTGSRDRRSRPPTPRSELHPFPHEPRLRRECQPWHARAPKTAKTPTKKSKKGHARQDEQEAAAQGGAAPPEGRGGGAKSPSRPRPSDSEDSSEEEATPRQGQALEEEEQQQQDKGQGEQEQRQAEEADEADAQSRTRTRTRTTRTRTWR